MLIPPLNWGYVERGLSRSGMPASINFDFLAQQKIKTIVYLASDEERDEHHTNMEPALSVNTRTTWQACQRECSTNKCRGAHTPFVASFLSCLADASSRSLQFLATQGIELIQLGGAKEDEEEEEEEEEESDDLPDGSSSSSSGGGGGGLSKDSKRSRSGAWKPTSEVGGQERARQQQHDKLASSTADPVRLFSLLTTLVSLARLLISLAYACRILSCPLFVWCWIRGCILST